MIEVKHLYKRYGDHVAVSDLSFTIEKGVIYGFLGPNGAGKSSTMNIIAGCLGATEGDVLIDGHSIAEEPIDAKKHIGYLPEQPPLYADMTPLEYLQFVVSAKGLSREEQSEQINRVIDRTGIREMRNRLICNLSKGYRQRVGIAQAILGNPEVIILDEPTVGLDPAQIIEIRDMIRELGRDHTIILSSHILSEVQTICNSIMIISKGRMVACDTPENLTRLFAGTTTLHLEVKGDEEKTNQVLKGIQLIENQTVKPGSNDTVLVEIKPVGNTDIREAVFTAFSKAELPLLEIQMEKASLEDIFLELTQGDMQMVPADKCSANESNVVTKNRDKVVLGKGMDDDKEEEEI